MGVGTEGILVVVKPIRPYSSNKLFINGRRKAPLVPILSPSCPYLCPHFVPIKNGLVKPIIAILGTESPIKQIKIIENR